MPAGLGALRPRRPPQERRRGPVDSTSRAASAASAARARRRHTSADGTQAYLGRCRGTSWAVPRHIFGGAKAYLRRCPGIYPGHRHEALRSTVALIRSAAECPCDPSGPARCCRPRHPYASHSDFDLPTGNVPRRVEVPIGDGACRRLDIRRRENYLRETSLWFIRDGASRRRTIHQTEIPLWLQHARQSQRPPELGRPADHDEALAMAVRREYLAVAVPVVAGVVGPYLARLRGSRRCFCCGRSRTRCRCRSWRPLRCLQSPLFALLRDILLLPRLPVAPLPLLRLSP